MVRIAALSLAVIVSAASVTALAAEDPILTRKKLMSAAGAAAGGLAGGMMKEEIPFNPVIAASAIRTLNAVAYSFGDYFPEGSNQGDTRAAPEIWENMAEFQEYLVQFRQTTDAAREADPKDLDAFKAAMGPVMETCGDCHDDFRLEGN
jgi:cytochrome c556